jgi:PAS domain-containing protein
VLSGYAPIRGREGKPVGIVGVDMDSAKVVEKQGYPSWIFYLVAFCAMLFAAGGVVLTERRRVRDEQTLRDSEIYFKTILQSGKAGTVIIDEATHEVIDANDAAAAMIGVPVDQMKGKTSSLFIWQ